MSVILRRLISRRCPIRSASGSSLTKDTRGKSKPIIWKDWTPIRLALASSSISLMRPATPPSVTDLIELSWFVGQLEQHGKSNDALYFALNEAYSSSWYWCCKGMIRSVFATALGFTQYHTTAHNYSIPHHCTPLLTTAQYHTTAEQWLLLCRWWSSRGSGWQCFKDFLFTITPIWYYINPHLLWSSSPWSWSSQHLSPLNSFFSFEHVKIDDNYFLESESYLERSRKRLWIIVDSSLNLWKIQTNGSKLNCQSTL